MKLLFDANLSPKLVKRLEDLFPASAHIFNEGIVTDADDMEIWRYAHLNAFTLVTTDSDFPAIATRLGCPPKVIWLQSWEYPTKVAHLLIRQEAIRIAEFATRKSCLLVLKNTGTRSVLPLEG